jgi:hypothetical protein
MVLASIENMAGNVSVYWIYFQINKSSNEQFGKCDCFLYKRKAVSGLSNHNHELRLSR